MTSGPEQITTVDAVDGAAGWQDDLRAAFAAPVPDHVADQHLARLRDALEVLHGPRDGVAVGDDA